MSETLDQQRAAFAWECASAGMKQHGKEYKVKEYKVLAKGAPALIMNSGLMPTLAFYNHKGSAAAQLLDDLIRGLLQRIARQKLTPGQGIQRFSQFMGALQTAESAEYLRYTDEALEILKWVRQFVDAVDA